MSQNPYEASNYAYPQVSVAQAEESDRIAFIRSTYLHLAAAIGAFVLLNAFLLIVVGDRLEPVVVWAMDGWHWLVFLGGFMVVSWIADYWAHSGASKTMQYLGLTLYVVAESILFVPLLYIANKFYPGAIESAGVVTLVVFGGLTATVFITKVDFSFLRMFLIVGGLAAMALIVVSIFFGGAGGMLGVWFSGAMVVLASGYILYNTSNIMRHYRTDQPVAASLALFASVALLFWYVLQLFMSRE